MSKQIVILVPTEIEIAPFQALCPTGVMVEVCGIGGAETAANTALAITRHAPYIVILAGIAGAYPSSGLCIGDSVLVDHEHIADMGAFHEDGFRHKFTKEYHCPYAANISSFPKVGSNSVNACAAPFVGGSEQAKIENMEGAAFFAICIAFGVPFLELRSISNEVSSLRDGWNISLSTKRLSESLITLINEINA